MIMDNRMPSVMQRRGELLARIASQREQLAGVATRLQTPFAVADRGLAAVRFLRSHPALVAGVAAVLVMRRRGAAGLARIFWRMWKGYRVFTAITSRYYR